MEDKNQFGKFEELLRSYRSKIVEPYDSRNRGSYFHWDHDSNKDGGVTYDNGGAELMEQGIGFITEGVLLFAPIFQDIKNRINKTRTGSYLVKECVQNLNPSLDYYIRLAKDGRLEKARDFLEIFKKVVGLREDIPFAYKEGLGEMLFHQRRIEEIGHACESYTHWTCRTLDEILQELHVEFLRDRRQEFGEALVKELLSTKYNLREFYAGEPLPAMQAQDAIRRYNVTNEDIIATADQALVLEAKTYAELAQLKRKSKSVKASHDEQRRTLLERIGIEPYKCE